MQKILKVLLAFIPFIVGGCETVIDVDVPREEPKLVVFSFINPHDEFVDVTVLQSNPIFNEEDHFFWDSIEDATVVISGPNGAVILSFDETKQMYSISADSLEIIPGEFYRLDIAAPGFNPVYATTGVPLEIPVFASAQVEVRETSADQGISQQLFDFDFSWQDVSDPVSYYEISIQQYNGEIEYRNYDDDGRNGEMINEQIESYNGLSGTMADPFHVYLLHTSEEYHRYKKSISNISFGDPFAEPSQVYSNITNGIGCFSSYIGTSVLITP